MKKKIKIEDEIVLQKKNEKTTPVLDWLFKRTFYAYR